MSDRELRAAAAASLYGSNPMNYRPYMGFDPSRSQHSINFITEDFLAGFMQDGRMSVVRRFFCLFVTFDLVFISLLWLICVMITGDNIYNALRIQVLHYTIYTSLFDIVVAALFRFAILVLFYGCIYTNHWSVVALCTSCSCAFLISKVFYYDWSHTPQPVFEVLLVIISFILSWGEAWFLDCRVIPQERHARSCYITATGQYQGSFDDRSPLLVPFLNSISVSHPESIGNFYSPYDSVHNSDDEDEQDDEYKLMGLDCVRKAYDLLESKDWKIEKVTSKGDTIQSTHRDKLGKIYRLTGRVNCSAKLLLQDLFYKIEEVPKWNPTLLESRIIRKIDPHTDITYQATAGGGGGVVKPRDFVNLRCWQLIKDGQIVEDYYLNPSNQTAALNLENKLTSVEEISEDSTSDDGNTNSENKLPKIKTKSKKQIKKSVSEAALNAALKEPNAKTQPNITHHHSLSRSLGAKDFNDPDQYQSDEDINFVDAQDSETISIPVSLPSTDVFVSAAISIQYPGAPTSCKYTRGENLVSCWAMREIPDQEDWCIFEWLLCLDLKGYIPRYVLDTAYTKLMEDYMRFLREYSTTIKTKQIKKLPQSKNLKS